MAGAHGRQVDLPLNSTSSALLPVRFHATKGEQLRIWAQDPAGGNISCQILVEGEVVAEAFGSAIDGVTCSATV